VHSVDPALPGSTPRRSSRTTLEQLVTLVRDPFSFMMVVVLLAKSWLAVVLINNPNHSVLNPAHIEDYETSLVIFVGFIVVPVALGFLFRGRSRLAYSLVLDSLLSALLITDVWYFRAHSTFLSFLLWQEVVNLRHLGSSIFAMSRPIDLLFLADLVVLLPLVLLWRRLYLGARRSVALALLLPLVSVVCLEYKHHELDQFGTDSDVRFVEPCWEARQTISFQSPLGFHVLDFFFVFFRNSRLELSSAQRGEIRTWYAETRETRPDSRYKGLLKGRNLIVVQVESLENFVIGHSVAGEEITPVLNSLLPNSLYFENINDQANEGMSSDSDLMTNTSVYPVRKGSTFFRFPGNTYNSLPRILRGAGYRTTLALHPDPAVYWNWKNALTSIGFDVCLDMAAFKNTEILGLGLSDECFLTQVGALLTKQPEPFYAYMVTLTSHGPFELPDDHCELTLDAKLADTILGHAFQSFRYVDHQIGRLLERLRESGVLDRSVVVFYGDHTSVHRFYSDEVAALDGLDDWMRDSRPLVPLIIYAPGISGERFAVTGGHIDTMPTLLYLLGVDEHQYVDTAMGRNLLNTGLDFAVLRKGTVVGRDRFGPFAKKAVRGLAIADMILRSDYFRTATEARPAQ
jgi:lipoteichoic acid synthase